MGPHSSALGANALLGCCTDEGRLRDKAPLVQVLVQVKFARFLNDRPPLLGGRFVLALPPPARSGVVMLRSRAGAHLSATDLFGTTAAASRSRRKTRAPFDISWREMFGSYGIHSYGQEEPVVARALNERRSASGPFTSP